MSGGEVCGGSGWQVPRMTTIGSFANLIAFIGQCLRTNGASTAEPAMAH